eukprot:7380740-Prymnesium_polylepis.1
MSVSVIEKTARTSAVLGLDSALQRHEEDLGLHVAQQVVELARRAVAHAAEQLDALPADERDVLDEHLGAVDEAVDDDGRHG